MSNAVTLIPALEDNYIALIRWGSKALAVDPSSALPVLKILEQEQLSLSHILITHHHSDHTGGNSELKEKTHCTIIGPDDSRIPGVDQIVCEGSTVTIGPYSFEVIAVPGHTRSHIAYYEPRQQWLFCGDTLFGAGCGMLFEGTPEQMFHSLNKFKQLPTSTLIFCGHEYTVEDLTFALSIEPSNMQIKNRLTKAEQDTKKGLFTVPFTLETELQTNPFLRADDPLLRQSLNMNECTDLEVFTHVRQLRNKY